MESEKIVENGTKSWSKMMEEEEVKVESEAPKKTKPLFSKAKSKLVRIPKKAHVKEVSLHEETPQEAIPEPKQVIVDEIAQKIMEYPDVHYKISPRMLLDLLYKYKGKDLPETYEAFEKFFTEMEDFADYSIIDKPEDVRKKPSIKGRMKPRDDEALIKSEFTDKFVNALFYLPTEDRYKFFKVRISPSKIKGAGMGVFAIDPIPEHARGIYQGVRKLERDTNKNYAWSIREYDEDTGESSYEEDFFYIDAQDPKHSNWTRYVNCGMKNSDNNLVVEQYYDKLFYIALKDIPAGTELFIDYGDDYRKDNLGMRGKY